MVALTGTGIEPVLLTDAIDKIRTVPPDGELVRVCPRSDISFGNGHRRERIGRLRDRFPDALLLERRNAAIDGQDDLNVFSSR